MIYSSMLDDKMWVRVVTNQSLYQKLTNKETNILTECNEKYLVNDNKKQQLQQLQKLVVVLLNIDNA